jgi:hypothetical protein
MPTVEDQERPYESYLQEIQKLESSPENDQWEDLTQPNEGPDIDRSRFQFVPGFLDGYAEKFNGLFKN